MENKEEYIIDVLISQDGSMNFVCSLGTETEEVYFRAVKEHEQSYANELVENYKNPPKPETVAELSHLF